MDGLERDIRVSRAIIVRFGGVIYPTTLVNFRSI
jgi:hypothetical protein